MNLLDRNISRVEKQFLSDLLDEVNALFENIWLPSHDALHHKRVWGLAKELMYAYSRNQVTFTHAFVEGLLLACMFHDVGLTKALGFEHGNESAKIARSYFDKVANAIAFDVKEVLEAIERHDDKSYLSASFETDNPTIYDLLTVADDLDAFGALGLYRYFEIYHLRKLDANEIPNLIKDNLKKRFQFVEKVIQVDHKLYQHHHNRYEQAQMYLEKLATEDVRLLLQGIDRKEILERMPKASKVLEVFILEARKEAGMD